MRLVDGMLTGSRWSLKATPGRQRQGKKTRGTRQVATGLKEESAKKLTAETRLRKLLPSARIPEGDLFLEEIIAALPLFLFRWLPIPDFVSASWLQEYTLRQKEGMKRAFNSFTVTRSAPTISCIERLTHMIPHDSPISHGLLGEKRLCEEGSEAEENVPRRHLLISSFAMCLLAGKGATAEIACRGLNGYDLRQCLREKRASSENDLREGDSKSRQFEQPGELITLPNGLQYREMERGSGPLLAPGALCSVSYIVYRLSSGAYFKYSSGGTPVYLFSTGYGYEGKDDFDSVYQFRYGEEMALPLAAALGMNGMRVGSRRRILIPPRYGWTDRSVNPQPDTFGGYRRLEAHKDEPLLFEVELKRLQLPNGDPSAPTLQLPKEEVVPFAFPVPPSPTQK